MANERGSVTILIALAAAVIIAVGLGFNWLVKEHIRTSEVLQEKAEAIIRIRSSYDTLIYLLLTGEVKENKIIFPGQEITGLKFLPLDGTEVMISDGVAVRAQDSNGRLSLTTLTTIDQQALRRLVRNEFGPAAAFVDSLLDWTDRDELARVNGAEAPFYIGSGLPYTPRNYSLQYPDEIALIRGADSEFSRRITPLVTYMPTSGFNPNTAGNAALKAVLDVNDGTATRISEYVSRKPVRSFAELSLLAWKNIAAEGRTGWFVPSGYLDIVVSAGGPRNLYRIKAGLTTGQGALYPYFIHYWQEE